MKGWLPDQVSISWSVRKCLVTFCGSEWRTDFTFSSIFWCWVVKIRKHETGIWHFSEDFSRMSLGLVVLCGGFWISEGETDDSIITTADVEVGWIGKGKAGGTYINIGVIWVDIDVEVGWKNTDVEFSWTEPSAVVSELRSPKILEEILVLSMVDCWQRKVLIFSFYWIYF